MILRARLWMVAVVLLSVTAFLLVFQPLTFHRRPHPVDKSLTLKPAQELPVGSLRLYVYQPQPALRLGLDLQGGLRVVLRAIRGATITIEPGEAAAADDAAKAALRQRILSALDPNEFPERTAEVNPAGNAVSIRVKAVDTDEMNAVADKLLERLRPVFPAVKIADDGRVLGVIEPGALQTIAEIMRRRVDQFGVSEPVIQPEPPDRIAIELPGLRNPEEFIGIIRTTAKMQWFHVPSDLAPRLDAIEEENVKPKSEQTMTDEQKKKEVAEILDASTLIITGADLRPTSQAQPGAPGQNQVSFHLKPEGGQKWMEFTRFNVNQFAAVILDGMPISVPVVQEVFASPDGVITGAFSVQYATRLASLLNAGALPMSLEILHQEVVSPTLGRDSLNASLRAGVIGALAILIFMLLYYRLPGLLADGALGIYTLLLLGVFWVVGITLTLPGIVGILLSMGMAIDSNIIIFERVKEEIRSGKTVRASIDAGFSRAWTAVFDASATTIAAALVLVLLGSGPVKGFGVALVFGVLLSLFTAVTVSRQLMILAAHSLFGNNTWLFGARAPRTTEQAAR